MFTIFNLDIKLMNEKYLKEINGVAIAHNTEEIIKQITEVIEKKNIRKKMAISSQQSVMKSHLYQNRLKVIELSLIHISEPM